jgi:hypothetical protein
MTNDCPTTLSPRWAESLLRLLLKPEDRDSVSGDLLEEYRESIVATLGHKADRWYVRQVSWYLLRATWLWGTIVGAALVVRYLFDTLAPVRDQVFRMYAMSNAIIAACFLAAAWTSLRTRSIRAGFIVSTLAGALGGAISIAGTGVLLAIWHDPDTLREWQMSGGLDEALIVVPLIMVAVGAVMGAAGALLGKMLAWPLPRAGRQA